MKTKTPKPRVMWANYYHLAGFNSPLIHATRSQAEAMAAGCAKPIRVAVIPLDDVEGIARKATDAFWIAYQNDTVRVDGICAALTAAGIPCKRKASK